MIKFFVKSLLSKQENEILYHFNEVKIGSNHLHCDLAIEDETQLAPIHLYIKIKNNNLAEISSAKDNIFFHINNKKVIGNIVLKTGDLIQIGQTQITIKEISFTPGPELTDRKKNLEEAIITHPEVGEVLSEIQNEIIQCERMIHE